MFLCGGGVILVIRHVFALIWRGCRRRNRKKVIRCDFSVCTASQSVWSRFSRRSRSKLGFIAIDRTWRESDESDVRTWSRRYLVRCIPLRSLLISYVNPQSRKDGQGQVDGEARIRT